MCIRDRPVTLTIGIPTNTFVTDYEDNFMTKMIEEETGIDLEFVFYPSTETATVIDLALASGDELPDVIVYGFGDNTASYGAQGYFQPLNEYFEKYSYFFWEAPGMEESDYDAYMTRTAEADGTIYGYSFYTKASGDQVRLNPCLLYTSHVEIPEGNFDFRIIRGHVRGGSRVQGTDAQHAFVGQRVALVR